MLDIKVIRDQPDLARQRLMAARGAGDEIKIDEILSLDEKRRHLLTEVEGLKASRNRVSKEIGALMGQKKLAEAEAKKKRDARHRRKKSRSWTVLWQPWNRRAKSFLLRVPNLPHPSVPVGKSGEDNPVIRTWGSPASFSFKPKDHTELCESLKLVDFARGVKLSGSGFLLYTKLGSETGAGLDSVHA